MNKIKLTEAEWRIMTALWKEKMTITQLTAYFKDDTGWSKNVIINFLKKMKAKNAVDYIQEPNVKVFYPLITHEEASLTEAQSFLDKIFKGSIGMLVNSLVDNNALSDDDISELKEIINRAENKKSGKDS